MRLIGKLYWIAQLLSTTSAIAVAKAGPATGTSGSLAVVGYFPVRFDEKLELDSFPVQIDCTFASGLKKSISGDELIAAFWKADRNVCPTSARTCWLNSDIDQDHLNIALTFNMGISYEKAQDLKKYAYTKRYVYGVSHNYTTIEASVPPSWKLQKTTCNDVSPPAKHKNSRSVPVSQAPDSSLASVNLIPFNWDEKIEPGSIPVSVTCKFNSGQTKTISGDDLVAGIWKADRSSCKDPEIRCSIHVNLDPADGHIGLDFILRIGYGKPQDPYKYAYTKVYAYGLDPNNTVAEWNSQKTTCQDNYPMRK